MLNEHFFDLLRYTSCQLIVLSIDHFRQIQDHLVVNYLIKHLIIIDINGRDGLSLFDHPTIEEDLPETLVIRFETDTIDVYYYWDDKLYNRFFMKNGSLLFDKPFFYKDGGLNLKGRELKVSLVVYTPFSYASYDVSIINIYDLLCTFDL